MHIFIRGLIQEAGGSVCRKEIEVFGCTQESQGSWMAGVGQLLASGNGTECVRMSESECVSDSIA